LNACSRTHAPRRRACGRHSQFQEPPLLPPCACQRVRFSPRRTDRAAARGTPTDAKRTRRGTQSPRPDAAAAGPRRPRADAARPRSRVLRRGTHVRAAVDTAALLAPPLARRAALCAHPHPPIATRRPRSFYGERASIPAARRGSRWSRYSVRSRSASTATEATNIYAGCVRASHVCGSLSGTRTHKRRVEERLRRYSFSINDERAAYRAPVRTHPASSKSSRPRAAPLIRAPCRRWQMPRGRSKSEGAWPESSGSRGASMSRSRGPSMVSVGRSRGPSVVRPGAASVARSRHASVTSPTGCVVRGTSSGG
jgi:hypothetical protein